VPELELPERYRALSRLGKGGGGEVWAVRDQYTGNTFALKVLARRASPHEMAALVRETVALSGLEGLGVPRVVHFGRMPRSGRPYLVRELVSGISLEALIDEPGSSTAVLTALAQAADKLTLLHRAGLLHGDVKPANVIVTAGGEATLVDLGLSLPWLEAGSLAEGLTPKYAAPELLLGQSLTVRAEVYALGTALAEILSAKHDTSSQRRARLEQIVARATADEPTARYPSADEFAAALRSAADIAEPEASAAADLIWPIVGIDATSRELLELAESLAPGAALRLEGATGSGRSTLLRRLTWSLGVRGTPVIFIDDELVEEHEFVATELSSLEANPAGFVLVDDMDALPEDMVSRLQRARAAGARVIAVGGAPLAGASEFAIPALDHAAAAELVRRAIPSLTETLLDRVVAASQGRPGELRRLVRALSAEAVASSEDIERVLNRRSSRPSSPPENALQRALHYLDRGRYNEAQNALSEVHASDRRSQLAASVAKARLALGLGAAERALETLSAARASLDAKKPSSEDHLHTLYTARALVGVGKYGEALALIEPLTRAEGALGAEARVYSGLALTYLERHDAAEGELNGAIEQARAAASSRVEAIALASLGLARQRADRTDEARRSYLEAIGAAERAGDAGTLATIQLNLAGLLKVSGDLAGAIAHFEAARDMGKRSGRLFTVRQALLDLANTDLYLGRLARARSSIETLREQERELPAEVCAQLLGLEAELFARCGELGRAEHAFEQCDAAYDRLGRALDAAEARLERVLMAAKLNSPRLTQLRSDLELARAALAQSSAHRSLLHLAAARLAWLSRNEGEARQQLESALETARSVGQREWLWRALEARAEIEEQSGQLLLARRSREEALVVLEEIAARLPRDLREVYWDDARRRHLRASVHVPPAAVAREVSQMSNAAPGALAALRSSSLVSDSQLTPLERRLARILQVNSELAGEHDLERLTARIVDHAVDLLRAERGFVLLLGADGTLSAHTSRSRLEQDLHLEFSRSIAAQVIETGEPVVSLSALDDARMNNFPSVHQLMLQSVACVPIAAPNGRSIGALYLETRLRKGAHFEAEIGTLRALADQVAIALESARLIRENQERAAELAESNRLLAESQKSLEELLEGRTLQLKRTRQKLRETRDTLYGHFGYLGLVGTSAAMRRVYALIERLKSTDVPVLITGESGTGKEVVARAIHSASPRAKSKFLGVNCGAIPEHLLEAELFGHVRGAYTGADRDRRGLFREAEGGSILLDEIGEMPHKMQAGLLRVLQDRNVRPVGGTREEAVDVRLLFATNRDLAALVAAGKFREDLFYRIHVVQLELPPLRERAEDIAQLTDHFLGIFSARYRREKKSVSREALRKLCGYAWPGNVRQLEHVLLNAWVLSDEPEIEADDLDLPGVPGIRRAPARSQESSHHGRGRNAERISRPPVGSGAPARRKSRLSDHRSDERERILKALQACNWNRVKAAKLSGIPRRTFYRRLREYGIQ
jgi:transcriptional regulator with GAF, ATPase, and Fis domain/serine/threonine protein kinase